MTKGTKNVMVDHSSRIEVNNWMKREALINDDFPDEYLMSIEVMSWYTCIVNYLVPKSLPPDKPINKGKNYFFISNITFRKNIFC